MRQGLESYTEYRSQSSVRLSYCHGILATPSQRTHVLPTLMQPLLKFLKALKSLRTVRAVTQPPSLSLLEGAWAQAA